jgi:hypothetical protein
VTGRRNRECRLISMARQPGTLTVGAGLARLGWERRAVPDFARVAGSEVGRASRFIVSAGGRLRTRQLAAPWAWPG